MTDKPRLIEVAFPLKQTSLDSVHEKNVRHGHISTLHIWPARRPLAACRAALIATLLPDPGNDEERKRLLDKLGGKVVQVVKQKKLPNGKVEDKISEETVGGILHWGRESGPDLDFFREEIKRAYGGRAPKVLDPFAGGGAIPLEAMRLGCEATAIDINPVAWFILKCTLEYPQRLASKKRKLPPFVLTDRSFMESFFKAQGFKGALLRTQMCKLGFGGNDSLQLSGLKIEDATLEADLAWHVRAWGIWVLNQARRTLGRFYPTYAYFQPLAVSLNKIYEKREPHLVSLKENGSVDVASLNREFSEDYLRDKTNARWVAKPNVAYLWARKVFCKNCRAELPLLKTRWLCKNDKKRVLLMMEPKLDKSGVAFGILNDVPAVGGNAAQRREHDKRAGMGTMSRSGAVCPCCGTIMTMEDIRLEGRAGRLGSLMTAVVIDGPDGKEYRLPTYEETQFTEEAIEEVERIFQDIPFGIPIEPLPSKEALGFRVPLYGFDQWYKLFTPRQLLALGTFVKKTRAAKDAMQEAEYPEEWVEGIQCYLTICLDRLADYLSTICIWALSEFLCHTFTRFALPITWDFVEGNPIGGTSGNYEGAVDWVGRVIDHILNGLRHAPLPAVLNQSAKESLSGKVDIIVTDPPYYDAIPYSDLMDYFYVWARRVLHDNSESMSKAFRDPLSPKWDNNKNDGELIDDASRHEGDREKSKAVYEEGMYNVFSNCSQILNEDGKLVVVFAHKHPDAWEALVSAIIKAGFVVDGAWPIQTEREARMRAYASAALSSSVWLVCKKRSEAARPGWDNHVLEEMKERIAVRLHEFWDAGIRGPDFVWAATGPVMEAYSKHPVVKKANEPGQVMSVSEFLRHVRDLPPQNGTSGRESRVQWYRGKSG